MRLSIVVALVSFIAAPAVASAQQAATPAPTTGQTDAPATTPLEPQGYDYEPAGRRDPFVSLMRRGADSTRSGSAISRVPGLPGLSAGEISLKGIMASRGGHVAILQGADNRTYIVHPGDKLLDGAIRTITASEMVILQQVSDPLSLQKQREVRKVLRQTEEAR